MKRRVLAVACCLLPVACCLLFGGCGNVALSGEGMTAAQTSALDAFQAVQRANAATQPATPEWEKAYLTENFLQWRYFVRSARKDLSWGPKLEGE